MLGLLDAEKETLQLGVDVDVGSLGLSGIHFKLEILMRYGA